MENYTRDMEYKKISNAVDYYQKKRLNNNYFLKHFSLNFVNFIRFSDEKHYDIKRSGFVCSKWA